MYTGFCYIIWGLDRHIKDVEIYKFIIQKLGGSGTDKVCSVGCTEATKCQRGICLHSLLVLVGSKSYTWPSQIFHLHLQLCSCFQPWNLWLFTLSSQGRMLVNADSAGTNKRNGTLIRVDGSCENHVPMELKFCIYSVLSAIPPVCIKNLKKFAL